jgi:uncharacterized membrane protein
MLPKSWSDQKIEILVGNLLRAGVALSATVVFAGALVYLVRHGGSPANYSNFHGEPLEYRSIRGIFAGVARLRGRAIIQLGLLVLIATPIARVVLSVVGFAGEKDRLYVIVTSIVLVILLYSLLVSV